VTYDEIMQLTAGSAVEAEGMIQDEIVPALVHLWCAEYRASAPHAEIIDVRIEGFNYLFDLGDERLIAAYGFPDGADPGRRDSSRMRGFPQPPDGRVKGHAIAHQLGGGVDINLVPQNGVINSGAFRVLEREAARHPGCLYFSAWAYSQIGDQTPCHVVQGMIRGEDIPLQRVRGRANNALVVKVVRHTN
jgi:hypothetical protein